MHPTHSLLKMNSTGLHVLGRYGTGADTVRQPMVLFPCQMYILIDGRHLNLKIFGFTDPLTGQWKPKKLI